MTNDNIRALGAIHELIATCHDAAEGYGKAANGVHGKQLRDLPSGIAGDRERFASDSLQSEFERGLRADSARA